MEQLEKNPDKWIRKEVSARLNNQVVNTKTIQVVDVNFTGETQPLNYIAMSTQTKDEATFTKCKKQWQCTILLDCITRYLGTGNTGSRVLVNDIEDRVISLMKDFEIEGGFDVYRPIEVESSTSLDGHTGTETYFRQLIRYRIWLTED